ncbi:MAG: alpha/beta fold hydrolase [Spirochaetaceae bacterium]|nr:MAG: alpha/beta fold hydrolase [Spirochaetaceae bacterium]
MKKRIAILGTIIFLVGLVLALSFGLYNLSAVTNILVWAIAGMGMVLLIGVSGQLSLGHAAFVAIGAYSTAMVGTHLGSSMPLLVLSVLIGFGVSLVFALLIGLPALRLKGYYLAIATIAFGVGMQQVLNGTDALGGAMGLQISPIFDLSSLRDVYTFLVVLASFLLFYGLGIVIMKSPFGVKFRMIRDSEVAARSYGTNLTKNKLLVFVISSFYCSFAGSLYTMSQGLVKSDLFGLNAAINLLLIIIIGGAIMLEGALIGSVVIIGLPIILADAPGGSLSLVNGILLIIFVLLLPKGIAFELWVIWHQRLQKPYTAIVRFFYSLMPAFGKKVEVAPGTKMFYVEKGQGKPLIYIHGNFASRLWFKEVMNVPGYRAIAPDLVNFGRSSRIADSDIDTYADHLAAFIDELGAGPCYIVGQSLGGAVAMSLALRYPAKVSRMVLLDSSPVEGVRVPDEFLPIVDAIKDEYNKLKFSMNRIMGTRSGDLKLAAKFTKEAMLMNKASFIGNAKALDKFNYSSKASSNKVPTLVINGALDPVVTVPMAQATAKALNAECKIVDHVGHALNIEDPALFVRMVTEFDTE